MATEPTGVMPNLMPIEVGDGAAWCVSVRLAEYESASQKASRGA